MMRNNIFSTTVVFNLDRGRDAFVVNTVEEIIHIQEIIKLDRLLLDSLKGAKEFKDALGCGGAAKSLATKRYHDTIFISGVRGSGKTTFLLSVLECIKAGNGLEYKDPNNSQADKTKLLHFEGAKIESLGILDPTLLEQKEHIFVTIIARIRGKVLEKAEKTGAFKNNCEISKAFDCWEHAYRELACGLSHMDGLGSDGFKGDQWLDCEFVMETGVGRAEAADKLEENFRKFLFQSTKFLNIDAFIMGLDDIDTRFKSGWQVLEVLRKYCTTPQLITLISGDKKLYSLLVRNDQWKNFEDPFLKMEARTEEEIKELKETVSNLTGQYNLKIFKPERRLDLKTLNQLEAMGYEIKVTEGTNTNSLKDAYAKLLETLGYNKFSSDNYKFLTTLPLRTQKHLLYAKGDTDAITNCFLSSMDECDIDLEEIQNVSANVIPKTLDYLVKKDILADGSILLPTFSNQIINETQFALAALTTNAMRLDVSRVFDYWIKIGLSREMGTILEAGNKSGNSPSISNFVEECSLTQYTRLRYASRMATGYMWSYYKLNGKTDRPWHGVLPLKGFASTGRLSKGEKSTRIDEVLRKSKPVERALGYMAVSGVTDHKGTNKPLFSFYNFLGMLGELLAVAGTSDNVSDNSDALSRLLLENSQPRSYPAPRWAKGITTDSEDNETDNQDISDDEVTTLKTFSESFCEWFKRTSKPAPYISSRLVSNSFTRLFYTLDSMDEAYFKLVDGTPDNNLGKWMERMTVAFLNAVLVCDVLEHLDYQKFKSPKLQLRNPITTSSHFKTNIDAVKSYFEINKDAWKDLRFTGWLFSCPIWKCFLSDAELLEKVQAFSPYQTDSAWYKHMPVMLAVLSQVPVATAVINEDDLERFDPGNLVHIKKWNQYLETALNGKFPLNGDHFKASILKIGFKGLKGGLSYEKVLKQLSSQKSE